MKIVRGIAASAVAAGLAAVGFASPASADDFSGNYTADLGGETASWTVVPCGTDSFIPCVHISQTGGVAQPWEGDAQFSVGYWTIRVDRVDTIICDDGQKYPARTTYSWDPVTLSGQLGVYDSGVCGGGARSLYAPIKLTKVGAAEVGTADPAES